MRRKLLSVCVCVFSTDVSCVAKTKYFWRRQRFLPSATKLGQGYIFTDVCHSVNRGVLPPGGACSGGCLFWGGACSLGGWVPVPWGFCSGGTWWRPPRTATAAGGTHPTGKHSCFLYFLSSSPKIRHLRQCILKLHSDRRESECESENFL